MSKGLFHESSRDQLRRKEEICATGRGKKEENALLPP
jgi:hypothetical protein